MVKVTVNAGLAVEAGPTLSLNTVVRPDSYSVASVPLTGSGAGATAEVPLLPVAGTVVLLALPAYQSSGQPATVTVTPRNGTEAGAPLTVVGTLLLTNAQVLTALVDGGPRSLTLANPGSSPITVDVLCALDS